MPTSELVLVGSRALSFRAPNLLRRNPMDWDFIGTAEGREKWKEQNLPNLHVKEIRDIDETHQAILAHEGIFEFEIAKEGSNVEHFLALVAEDKETAIDSKTGIACPSLDILFALKASHRYLKNSPFFWKTLSDYHALKLVGAKIRPEWNDWFQQREKETYKFRTPKLIGAKKDEFFDPNIGVKYVYDHDSIHETVKFGEKPAYRYFIKDGEQVACSKQKFFALSDEVRLHSVVEESCVLAIERSQVPFPGMLTPKESFRIAFSKVLSSITSGWWREWGYDNALKALELYHKTYSEKSYMDQFNAGLESGIVKPFVGDSNPYK